jgi:hypothetical protein
MNSPFDTKAYEIFVLEREPPVCDPAKGIIGSAFATHRPGW